MHDVTVRKFARKGLIYEAEVSWLEPDYANQLLVKHTIIRKLDFIAYYFIRWIHGDQKLVEMASKIPDDAA